MSRSFQKSLDYRDGKPMIVDPSVFNNKERLSSLFQSGLLDKNRFYIPSIVYEEIEKEEWEQARNTLQSWETVNFFKPRIASWQKTEEFIELSRLVLKKTKPVGALLSDLSEAETVRYRQSLELLGEGSPDSIKIAKELLKAAYTKSIQVLSYSTNFLRWLREIPNIASSFLRTTSNALHHEKVRLKKAIENAGWKGQIYVWAVGWIAGTVIGALFNEQFLTGIATGLLFTIIANGVKT